MHEAVVTEKTAAKRFQLGPWAFRVFGLALLGVLLWRAELGQLAQTIGEADLSLVFASVALLFPLILLKTVRWQEILRAQAVRFDLRPAYLAYFGSIFIGFLTPGRLGEFVKALHVSRDCGVAQSRALASVLADRLFDLYALLIVGAVALVAVSAGATTVLAVIVTAVIVTVPLVLLMYDRAFGIVQRLDALGPRKMQDFSRRAFSWADEVRLELRKLTGRRLVVAVLLTVVSYFLFFGQTYLLALALDLDVSYAKISFVTALGSLVTLLPISISGLGTREAVMIAYLGTMGVAHDAALGFSLLVFLTFYVGGGLIGALAWLLKPLPLGSVRR
jgi:uncharacterized protein (TIRG00374 family)